MPSLTRVQVVALAVLAFVLLAVAGASLRRHLPPPVPPLPAANAPAPAGKVPAAGLRVSPVPPRPPVVVHVVGCVRQPGVYAFAEGARVCDAVKRAGGAKPGADLESINLAARLQDAVQVYVPRKRPTGERAPAGRSPGRRQMASAWIPPEAIALDPLPPAPAGRMPLVERSPAKGAPPPPGAGNGSPAGGERPAKIRTPADGRVNLNTAEAAELQRLPHIGPAMAQRILDYRKENGAFRSVEQLLEVRGIGPKYFADLRDLVEL